MKTLDVLFTPADFAALKRRNLDDTLCVVLDVFRATSSIVTALANGAEAVVCVSEISEALELRRQHPDWLLAGERDGIRIRAELTGGIDFDLGNSPREFAKNKVAGKTIVTTTTNGTRALQSSAHARLVLVSSFLNLKATAEFIARQHLENVLLVCSGTFDEAALEDVLGAGALCDLLWNEFGGGQVSDAALMARQIFQTAQSDLMSAASRSRNGRRLLAMPGLRDDVEFCLRRDVFNFTAALQVGGKIKIA